MLVSLLGGLLGGVGDSLQQKQAQDLTLKVQRLTGERQMLTALMNDPSATPAAKTAAIRAVIQSYQNDQGGGRNGKRGQAGESDPLAFLDVLMGNQAMYQTPEEMAAQSGRAKVAEFSAQTQGLTEQYGKETANRVMGISPPVAPSSIAQKIKEVETALGTKLTPEEVRKFVGLEPKTAAKSGRETAVVVMQGDVPTGIKWTDSKGDVQYASQGIGAPPDIAPMFADAMKGYEQGRQNKIADEQRAYDLRQKALDHSMDERDKLQSLGLVRKRVDIYTDAKRRYGLMMRNLPAALQGNAQAQVLILFNHIGMTLSAQRGARITNAEIQRAASARSLPAELQVRWDHLQQGTILDGEQMKQMVQLADDSVRQNLDDAKGLSHDLGVEWSKAAPGIAADEAADEAANAIGPVKTADDLEKKYKHAPK